MCESVLPLKLKSDWLTLRTVSVYRNSGDNCFAFEIRFTKPSSINKPHTNATTIHARIGI